MTKAPIPTKTSKKQQDNIKNATKNFDYTTVADRTLYKYWTCAELCEAFTFLMENMYMQFERKVYQQVVGIAVGTNCAPLIAELLLLCYERDFKSNRYISKC